MIHETGEISAYVDYYFCNVNTRYNSSIINSNKEFMNSMNPIMDEPLIWIQGTTAQLERPHKQFAYYVHPNH